LDENQELNKFLDKNKQDLEISILEMNKTKDEIRKYKVIQASTDEIIEKLKKDNEVLKSQIELNNQKLLSQQNQDQAIVSLVENTVMEYKVILTFLINHP
jgi:hypothetical protein